MTDIVARLRDNNLMGQFYIRQEAAEEIELLRSTIKKIGELATCQGPNDKTTLVTITLEAAKALNEQNGVTEK